MAMWAGVLLSVVLACALVAFPGVVGQAAPAENDLCTTLLRRGATCEFPGGVSSTKKTLSAYTFTVPATTSGSDATVKYSARVTLPDGVSTCINTYVEDLECMAGTGDKATMTMEVTPVSATGDAVCSAQSDYVYTYSITQGSSADELLLSDDGFDDPTTCTLAKAAGSKSTPSSGSTPPSGSGGGSNVKPPSNAATSSSGMGSCMLLLAALACGLQMFL